MVANPSIMGKDQDVYAFNTGCCKYSINRGTSRSKGGGNHNSGVPMTYFGKVKVILG